MKKHQIIIVAILAIYCIVFIYRSSAVIQGERYFTLFDDTMISMDYAKNLAHGNGLVWYKGADRVEGFSNPLWVGYMSIFHILPIPLSKTSLFIQLTGMVFLLLTVIYVGKIAQLLSINTLIPMILVSSYYALIYWSLMGLEVSVLMFITTFAVYKYFIKANNLNFIFVLLGLSTYIRLDMAVVFLVFWLYIIVKHKTHYKSILILFGFIGVQIMIRYLYYGEILPNTYYLKLTGYPIHMRVWQGIITFADFVHGLGILLFLIPFFLYPRKTNILVFIIIGQMLYSIYVGGDAWENMGVSNRYISIIMPLFFVIFADALYRIRHKINIITVMILIIVSMNYNTIDEFLMVNKPKFVEQNADMVRYAQLFNTITRPTDTIAVTWAGIIPYHLDRTFYDFLGKCDKKIGHQQTNKDVRLFVPGHTKWDYNYTISELKPDIIPFLWGRGREELWPLLHKDYQHIAYNGHDFWVKNTTLNLYQNMEKIQELFVNNNPYCPYCNEIDSYRQLFEPIEYKHGVYYCGKQCRKCGNVYYLYIDDNELCTSKQKPITHDH